MTNQQIETVIENLLNRLGIKSLPIPVDEIAEKLDIRIKRAPSEDFSGLLLRKDGRALIGINDNESSVRQRFTVAHEIGHFLLHPAQEAFVDYRDNQKQVVRSKKEREANVFAAALLMPRSVLKNDAQKLSTTGIFDNEINLLAKKYNVSKESMNYRLLNLGLN